MDNKAMKPCSVLSHLIFPCPTSCLHAVTKCSPPLQCLPGLLSTLNQTGDFSGFTKEVRAAFQKGL
jgi:hypothetical protein